MLTLDPSSGGQRLVAVTASTSPSDFAVVVLGRRLPPPSPFALKLSRLLPPSAAPPLSLSLAELRAHSPKKRIRWATSSSANRRWRASGPPWPPRNRGACSPEVRTGPTQNFARGGAAPPHPQETSRVVIGPFGGFMR